MSIFKEKVIEVVRAIPYGMVASYGQVALYVGAPRAAREVGWTLNRLENTIEVPWWRVINNTGRITIKGSEFSPDFQRKLLRAENIVVSDDFSLQIDQYRWKPKVSELLKLELDREYLDHLSDKYKQYFDIH